MSITCTDATNLTATASAISRNVQTVLDIGAGVHPQKLVDAALTVCCEPDQANAARLIERCDNGENIAVLNLDWETAIELLPDKSVDTVTLINVVHLLDKQVARTLLQKTERITRQQIIVVMAVSPDASDLNANERRTLADWSQQRSTWVTTDFDDSWRKIEAENTHAYVTADRTTMFCAIKDLNTNSRHRQIESEDRHEHNLSLDHVLGLITAVEPTMRLTDASEIQRLFELTKTATRSSGDGIINSLLEQNRRRSKYIVEARRGITDLRRLFRAKTAEHEIAQKVVPTLYAQIEKSDAENSKVRDVLRQREDLITDLTYQCLSLNRSLRERDAQINELNQHLQAIKTGLTWRIVSFVSRIFRRH